jgi:hypothetical protein
MIRLCKIGSGWIGDSLTLLIRTSSLFDTNFNIDDFASLSFLESAIVMSLSVNF